MTDIFTKTFNEDYDRQFNWSTALGTDTIASSEWSTSDPALVVSQSNFTATAATVWLSGGVVGSSYIVTNKIVTAAGRTFEDSFPVYVQQYNFV